MDRIDLRAYRRGDEAAFTPREDFAEEMAMIGHDWSGGPPTGHVWTLTRDHEVIGLAGVHRVLDRRPEAWAWVADLAPRDWVALVRLGRKMLGRMPQLGPVEASCRLSSRAAQSCLERIGFEDTGEVFDAPIGAGIAYRMMVRRA